MIASDSYKTPLQEKLTPGSRKSALARYRETVVGSRGLVYFFFYETVFVFLCILPGLLGAALRKLVFPLFFRSVGRNVYFGAGLCVRNPGEISIGSNVIIDDDCVLDAKGPRGRIAIGSNVCLARNTVLSCKGGDILIGDNANLGMNTIIHSEKNVTVGDNVLISSMCYIVGGGNHGISRLDIPVIAQDVVPPQGIVIGDGCWLGASVVISDGVRVGRGAVVGACSLVRRDVPENTISYGIPARVARSRMPQA